jgi:hypothetical protein
MPRLIVIDKTVIDQLNRDNKDLAKFILHPDGVNYLISGSYAPHYWMTAADYATLNEADRQLCKDLGVTAGNTDEHYVGSLRRRSDNRMRYVAQMDPDAFKNIAPEHEATIALAFGNELLTFDRKLAETYGRLTARLREGVVPELKTMSVSNKPVNYNAARRNLVLRPLKITPSGAIFPTPGYTRVMMGDKTIGWVPPDKGGIIDPRNPPRTRGGAITVDYFWSSRGRTADIDSTISPKADESVAVPPRKTPKGIPVVKFDFQSKHLVWRRRDCGDDLAGRQRHCEPVPNNQSNLRPVRCSGRQGLQNGAVDQTPVCPRAQGSDQLNGLSTRRYEPRT